MRPTRPSSDGARDEIVAKNSGEALELLVVHFFTCQGPNIPLRPVWSTVGLMCSGAHKKNSPDTCPGSFTFISFESKCTLHAISDCEVSECAIRRASFISDDDGPQGQPSRSMQMRLGTEQWHIRPCCRSRRYLQPL